MFTPRHTLLGVSILITLSTRTRNNEISSFCVSRVIAWTINCVLVDRLRAGWWRQDGMKYCMRSPGAGHHQTADRCVVHCLRSLHRGTLGTPSSSLAFIRTKRVKYTVYCYQNPFHLEVSSKCSFLNFCSCLPITPMTRVQLPRFNIPEHFRHRNNGIIVYGDMSTILTPPRARGFWSSCNTRY